MYLLIMCYYFLIMMYSIVGELTRDINYDLLLMDLYIDTKVIKFIYHFKRNERKKS